MGVAGSSEFNSHRPETPGLEKPPSGGGGGAEGREDPPLSGGYYYFPSDEDLLRFLSLSPEERLEWVWEMNALLSTAPPETRRLHALFRRGEI